MKQSWLIGIGGSETDGVRIIRLVGTKRKVKQFLMQKIREERANFNDAFDFGTMDLEDIEERKSGSLYGFNCFDWFHTDYEAYPEPVTKTIDLSVRKEVQA